MNNNEIPSRETLIRMLGYALVEIRGADDIKLIKAIADIFHNLPGALISCDHESNKRAYDMIIKKSKKWKLNNYIIKLKETAELNE